MIQQHQKIIKTFKGKKNSDDVLVMKAKMLTPTITDASTIITKTLLENLSKKKIAEYEKNGTLFKVIHEIFFFYIHILDRLAFQDLGHKKRQVFMNKLFDEAQVALFQLYKDLGLKIPMKDFVTIFTNDYDHNMNEYSKFEMIGQSDNYTNDISWHLGTKIAKLTNHEVGTIFVVPLVLSFFAESCYPIVFAET